VQPLETEANPRSTCVHCGTPLPPPNGTATFVYGVGAVGYQSCASCGAKWRYLWQDQPLPRVKSDRNPRLGVVLGAGALVVLLVVGGFALARSQRWNRTDTGATPTASSSVPVTSPRSSDATVALGDVMRDYALIAIPMSGERAAYMSWLVDSATATPQYEVNQRTQTYVDGANAAIAKLEADDWPDDVAAEIDSLVETARQFVDDLEPVRTGQAGSPAYITMITDEADAVGDAEAAVQQRFSELQASD
jgi:hypothetical protein